MKLLLDQGLPRTIAAILTKAGIETVHVLRLAASDMLSASTGNITLTQVSNKTGGIFRPLSSARAEARGSSMVLLEFLDS